MRPRSPSALLRDMPRATWGVLSVGLLLALVAAVWPNSLDEVGGYDTSNSAYGVAVAGDYAYIAASSSGLMVVDVSDPTDPIRVGSYDTSHGHTEGSTGSAMGVAVAGDYAYVADGGDGLVVVNVSDPTNPVRAGGYDTPGHARGVAVSGDYAYVAEGDGGLVVVDVSDPANPTRAGGYDTHPHGASDVAVSDGYAYIAGTTGGLVVVNVSDPANLTYVGNYDTFPGNARDVAVSNGYAYVAAGSGGLIVVDVSDPANPTRVGDHDTSDDAYGVAVSGGYAYVADGSGGLVVVDVSDPANPTRAGGRDTSDDAYGVAVSDGYAYVAVAGSADWWSDGGGGLVVLGPPAPWWHTPLILLALTGVLVVGANEWDKRALNHRVGPVMDALAVRVAIRDKFQSFSKGIPYMVGFFVVIGFVLLFVCLIAEDNDYDTNQDNQPDSSGYSSSCCDINLKVEHMDSSYSELSYVIYFDDSEKASGTLDYGDSKWYFLCTNCSGSHTIEVYWGDGDECQADVELSSSDKTLGCTNR